MSMSAFCSASSFAAYFNKPSVIRTGFETQRAERCRAEGSQPDGNASGGPLAELPDSPMFIERSHRTLKRERVFPAVPERTIRRDLVVCYRPRESAPNNSHFEEFVDDQ
jgi:hypothetical protein